MKTLRTIVAIAAFVVLFDQWSKHWAVGSLSDGHTVHVISTLRFNLSFNSGMAFSKGTNAGPVIGVLSILVTAALIIWQVRIARESTTHRVLVVAAGLIVGGAWGNIVDRLFRGEGGLHGRVVDFIDLQWWPVFNVADAAVTVGVILMALSMMREPGKRNV